MTECFFSHSVLIFFLFLGCDQTLELPRLRRMSLRRCVLLSMCSLGTLTQLEYLQLENNTYHAGALEAMQPELLHTQVCFAYTTHTHSHACTNMNKHVPLLSYTQLECLQLENYIITLVYSSPLLFIYSFAHTAARVVLLGRTQRRGCAAVFFAAVATPAEAWHQRPGAL